MPIVNYDEFPLKFERVNSQYEFAYIFQVALIYFTNGMQITTTCSINTTIDYVSGLFKLLNNLFINYYDINVHKVFKYNLLTVDKLFVYFCWTLLNGSFLGFSAILYLFISYWWHILYYCGPRPPMSNQGLGHCRDERVTNRRHQECRCYCHVRWAITAHCNAELWDIFAIMMKQYYRTSSDPQISN